MREAWVWSDRAYPGVTVRIARGSLACVVLAATAVSCGSPARRLRPAELPTAIDLAGTEPAEETYDAADLQHLRYVLDADQAGTYARATVEERREVLRLAWARLDPTPTTERNERREAHYRRVAYARAHFRRNGSPPWDKRGELLIRYGSPQGREIIPAVLEPGRFIPPRELWSYAWPAMSFEVMDVLLKDDFQDSYQWMESSRVDLAHGSGGIDEPAGPSGDMAPPPAEAEAAQHEVERRYGRGFHELREGTNHYLHDFGGRQLAFVFDVLDFASRTEDTTTVEVNLLFDERDLEFREHVAEVEVEVVAKTQDFREVARASHRLREAGGRRRASRWVVDQIRLDLPPGGYLLALQARDTRSGNVGVFTTETEVRRFPSARIAISDLQLASSVTPGVAGSRFTKGRFEVIPHPPALFIRGSGAHLYFEVYGLGLSPTGASLYTVHFAVTPRAGKDSRRPAPTVASSYDGNARSPDIQETFRFDTSTLLPGVYDLGIRVTDRVTDAVAERSVAIRVIAPVGR